MAVNLSPYGGVGAQFLDNSGNVLTGGKIYTYSAGTTTPQPTYTTSAGNIPHSNPIILDAAGRVPSGGEIWLTDGLSYKFILRDANDVLIATYDNISGINSNFIAYTAQQEIQTATAGQTVFNLTTMQYQPATNNLSVFVDGVNQYGPGAQYAYVETDSDTVTFVSGLHVGASVKFTTASPVSSSSTNAANVSFTGVKGQTGNVADLGTMDGSDWVGFQPDGTGAVSANYSIQDKLRQTVSVMDFGAVGDGVTDDTVAIQAALDHAATLVKSNATYPYGTIGVQIPSNFTFLITTIEIPSGVGLVCTDGIAYLLSNETTGVMIDTPVVNSGNTPIYNIMLKGLYLKGSGVTGTLIGLRINNCQNAVVENCRATNFGGSAFVIQSKFDGSAFTGLSTSNTCYFREVRAFDCVLNSGALSQKTGSFDIMGSDHEFYACETFASLSTTYTGSSQYRVGWNLTGVNEARFIGCKGSLADQGWFLDEDCLLNYFSDLRADANFAEGVYVKGVGNFFENIDLNGNGRNATNTYACILFESTATRNYVSSGSMENNAWPLIQPIYNVSDYNTTASQPNRIGASVLLQNAGTAAINNFGGYLSVTLPDGISLLFSANSSTPSVANSNTPFKNWKTNNSVPTNVTNFTNGFVGQIICVESGDPNTTIKNGASIVTITGSDLTSGSGKLFNFRLNASNVWVQF